MKFIDMFAGIGGFRSGLEKAGHKCIGYIEWDKFARQSYQAMYDTRGEFTDDDIQRTKGIKLPEADLWTFGSPCTNISLAGNRTGIRGEASRMFFEVIRLLKERAENQKTLPAYLIMENVKNLLSSNQGRDFAEVIYQMDKVAYDAEWCVFDSAEVVPQHRERTYIVGHLRGKRTRGVFPIVRKNGKTNKTIKAVNQIGNISNSKSFNGNPQVGRVYGTDGLSPTLSTMQGGGREPKILDDQGRTKKRLKPLSISPTLRSQSHGNEPKIAIPVITPDRIKKQQNGRRFKTNGEPEFTLTGQDIPGVLVRNIKKYAYKVRPNAHPAISITAIGNIRGHRPDHKKAGLSELQFTNPQNVASTVIASHCPKTWTSDFRIRKLTPRECWRLQGFTDEQFDKAKKAGVSNSQLYKQAGNAVTVPVVCDIGKKLPVSV